MKFNIYSEPVRKILTLMESSTGHLYYTTEIVRITGYSRTTVTNVMKSLYEAGIVTRSEEIVTETTRRPPRINFEYTPDALYTFRLHPRSE
jgi:DNA-binding transcriptional ArsR family regulator